MISSSSLFSCSGNTDAIFQSVWVLHLNHENEQICGREQPHTPLDIKIHLKLIPSNCLAVCRSGQRPETCTGLGFIWILALRTYSLLFPLRFSPLSSSPHLMLWVPVEKSLLLFPLGSIFSSRSLFRRWSTCFSDVPAGRFFSSRPLSAAPPQLSDIHPLRPVCALAFERTAGAAGPHRGKGGVEGWRKQGGVDVGRGEGVSGHGIPERNLKCFHRADQEQDTSRIINVNKEQ